MAFTIPSGNIQPGILYQVLGTSATVSYNGVTYSPGSVFRGASGVNTFTVTNGATVTEVTELNGGEMELFENLSDSPVFSDATLLKGMALVFDLASAEIVVSDVTRLQGFAIEFADYPFYSFEITETRL